MTIPQPKVSIIMPVFNAATTLEAALLSVMQQTYENKELIVVDGQSTDGSLTVLQRYGKNITHLISEKDSGVYAAINKGIDRASGEWIYIMGADDVLPCAGVLKEVFATDRSGVRLIYGIVHQFETANTLVKKLHVSKFGRALYWRNTVHQQSAFYHRSLFNTMRFDDSLKILADYDFHLRLFRDKVRSAHHRLVIARCSARGLSKNFNRKLYSEELRLKRKRLPLHLYLLNVPWVVAKFLGKQVGGG